MLILFTFTAVFSALLITVLFAKGRKNRLFKQDNSRQFNFEKPRPLFAPTDEEIRAFEREKQEKLRAKEREEKLRLTQEKIGKVFELEKSWRVSPDRKTTAELLSAASETANAKAFADIAENVIEIFREDKIKNLSARDLADLLDSHFRLLPQQERTSGAIFRLRRRIETLRSQSEAQPDERKKPSEFYSN